LLLGSLLLELPRFGPTKLLLLQIAACDGYCVTTSTATRSDKSATGAKAPQVSGGGDSSRLVVEAAKPRADSFAAWLSGRNGLALFMTDAFWARAAAALESLPIVPRTPHLPTPHRQQCAT
jgi:hypothetical protein